MLAVAVAVLLAVVARPAPPAVAHSCVKSNELWFRAADGTKLVGHRFGGKRPGSRTSVVLAHMSEGDLCSWLPYARSLAAKGFFVFPFDFRGHGFSEGRENHRRAPGDVAAAVRAVRSLGARRIVVAGASLGGIAALLAAPAIRPPVAGVVAVSAPAAIPGELDALPSVRRLTVPTLYIAAESDQTGSYDFAADARVLLEATATSSKRLELVPGSLHGTFLVLGSPAVRERLLEFFRAPARVTP